MLLLQTLKYSENNVKTRIQNIQVMIMSYVMIMITYQNLKSETVMRLASHYSCHVFLCLERVNKKNMEKSTL